jgi:hypothetical protein
MRAQKLKEKVALFVPTAPRVVEHQNAGYFSGAYISQRKSQFYFLTLILIR